MTNFDIYKEYIKDNTAIFYLGTLTGRHYFCAGNSCASCTIRKLCLNNRDPNHLRPFLTQKEIEIAQEENPEFFL